MLSFFFKMCSISTNSSFVVLISGEYVGVLVVAVGMNTRVCVGVGGLVGGCKSAYMFANVPIFVCVCV